MGSGKTTIGKYISAFLKYEHVDTDRYIEGKAGMSIAEIFRRYGEEHFRRLENEAAAQISQYKGCVISTGGGMVKNEENMRLFKRNGIVVYLKSSPEKIFKNTEGSTNRPLLNTGGRKEEIERLMREREPLYLKYSDLMLDTADLSVETAAKEICEWLLQNKS